MNLIVAVLQIALTAGFAQVPEPAPNLNIDGVDGHRMVIRPAVLQKPLLVHFFSTQTGGWKNELLKLKAMSDVYAPKGMVLVSIAAPKPGAREMLAAFATKNGITFPVAVDEGNLSALSAERVPRLVLITPDATIALRLYESAGDAEIREIELRLPALLIRRQELLGRAAEAARYQAEFEAAAVKVSAVPPDELKARLGTPMALYFIGDRKVFDQKHIPGAVHLDYADVDQFFKDKDKNQVLIFYCDCTNGPLGRSGRVATKLYLKGFKRAAYLKGQLQEWEKRKYPLQVRID